MKLKKVIRESKRIRITTEVRLGGEPDAENVRKQTDDYHEQPLPEFSEAFLKLESVATTLIEVGAKWSNGLTIEGFSLRETKGGTRSVMLHCLKLIDNKDSEWSFTTPWARIDKAQDGENGSLGMSEKHAALVATAIHESERYLTGERSQKLLFDDSTTNKGEDMFSQEEGESE